MPDSIPRHALCIRGNRRACAGHYPDEEELPMKTPTLKCALALALAGILAAGPVMAKNDKHERDDRPGNRGGKHERDDRHSDRGGKHDRNDDRRDDRQDRADRRAHFEERHRVAVRDYYGEQFRKGRCPPGLAKKNNGCMPPGQAKKWHVGQPLAREVVYYSVPQTLVVRIGPPPPGYRYVRVDSDILLLAIGTRMVVDAIENLSRG
jgi:Ni/Co efflux regulator RcnB